jgi:hypothetical protein
MHRSPVVRLALVAALAVVTSVTVPVRAAGPDKFEGVINEYTDPASSVGLWHITGKWSVHLKGTSGKADFAASIAMIRPATGASPHTHHVLLEDATVTTTANGWNIEGEPTITTNGAPAFAGSTVKVEVTGDSVVLPSNVKFTFQGPAVGHFGAGAIDGVVAVD